MTNRQPDHISRRTALRASGLSLGALAGLHARAGLTQAVEIPSVIQAFVDAWAALDPVLIGRTYAPDGIREDVTTPAVVKGREAIVQSLTSFFAAFGNANIEHPAILAGPAPYAADAWVFTGDYVGSLPGLPAGSGETVTIRGFTLIEIAGDQIQATTDYYDSGSILDQLGTQAPLAPATPVATPAGD